MAENEIESLFQAVPSEMRCRLLRNPPLGVLRNEKVAAAAVHITDTLLSSKMAVM
jgi:hypothetical protein